LTSPESPPGGAQSPPAPPAPTDRATHTAVLTLSAATFLSGAALRICDGLIPRLAADFNITAGIAGRVIVTFSIAYGVMQLVFGPLGDRFGKAKIICVALSGGTATALWAAFSQDFDSLVIARIGWGMSAAGIIPASLAWVGDAVPYERRQATIAKLLGGTLSGMMAGQLAGGLFADSAVGWRGAFITIAIGYALVACVLLIRIRELAPRVSHPPAKGFPAQLRAVLGTPWSYRILGSGFVEGMFLLGPLAFLPAYLHTRFGISLSAAAGMVALYALGGLAYAAVAPRIVRNYGERRMVAAGGWVMGAGFLLWLLSPLAWSAAPVALLVGFGTYLYHNTLQTHATQMAPAARGTAVGLFAFCLFFGQAIGAIWAGYAFDHFGGTALLVPPILVLPLAGWALARALRARHASS
jgi:predicted MFS family arabinose efflux permease